mmetsp:Transcript_27982/g.67636  ORF Transcript_27982/g.67636 Transcript_27982/m.67636 type:complete len:446 (+) Transcript_27982:48-1385(+)
MSDDVDKQVLRRYDVVEKLGRGAYGIVWKCVDRETKQIVAVKKIFDAFETSADAQRTYREIVLLEALQSYIHVVTLLSVLKALNDRDIYLVFDFLDFDLHHVIRRRALQQIHHTFVLYQLLACLKYLHSAAVIHRDLKPSNILINGQCVIKLADFGLARSFADAGERDLCEAALNPHGKEALTDYVATRWYRAPEIMLGSSLYSKEVDLWSAGCIFGEMIVGKPIFPGSSTMNQLDMMLEVTGMPTLEDVDGLQSPFAATMLQAFPLSHAKTRPLRTIFAGASAERLDLLQSLLKFNPATRVSAVQALQHRCLSDFHNPSREVERHMPITLPVCDGTRYPAAAYRDRLYAEILEKHKDSPAVDALQQSTDLCRYRTGIDCAMVPPLHLEETQLVETCRTARRPSRRRKAVPEQESEGGREMGPCSTMLCSCEVVQACMLARRSHA